MSYFKIDIKQELRKVARGQKTKVDVKDVLWLAARDYPELQAAIGKLYGIKMKTLLPLLLVLLFAVTASAETIHITGVKKATDTEKTYKTIFNQNLITGTVGSKQYTLEQLAAFGAYHYEVGTDYPVTKITNSQVKVQVTDKKGRLWTDALNIVEVKEQ